MSYWPLLICLVATWYFVGLIWTIQLVSYPLFIRVDQASFALYHAEHSRRITLALGLPFLLVMGSSILLLWLRPVEIPLWAAVCNLALGFGVWVLTGLIYVPLHTKLGEKYELRLMEELVRKNWLRTLVWTGQGMLLLGMVVVCMVGH